MMAFSSGSAIKNDFSGFVPKSLWTLPHALEWLGFGLDTTSMPISVPTRKLDKVKEAIIHLLESKSSRIPVRSVAFVVGQLISMKLVLGPIVQLMTSI